MKKQLNIFVVLIATLSVISSLVGLLYQYESDLDTITSVNGQIVSLYQTGLYYRDSVSVASQGIASDLITLIIGVPALLLSLFAYNKDSLKGKILLTGMVGYFLYTYVSYVFLWNYNFMFLVYVMLMSLSLFTFIYLMTQYDYASFKNHFSDKTPLKLIGIYQIVIGVFVMLMWLGTILSGLVNNQTPEIVEHYTTLVIQALDLGIVVPAAIMSGVLLLKKENLGFVMSSVIVVKGTMMVIAILAMIINQMISGIEVNIIVTSMFSLFSLISVYVLYKLLLNVNKKGELKHG